MVHNGIYRNGTHRRKNDINVNELKDDLIPIFGEDGKLKISIPQKRFHYLFESYMTYNEITQPSPTNMKNINTALHDLAEKLRLHTNTSKWKIPTKINRSIINESNITTLYRPIK